MLPYKTLFVANARAGQGHTGKLIPLLNRLIANHNYPYDFLMSKSSQHAIDSIADRFEKGFRRFVAIGGDGTLNSVANGILQTKDSGSCFLGLVPGGGGNDFARSAEISTDISKALMTINVNATRKIDVGKIEDFYFVNSLGIGFDAETLAIANSMRRFNGKTRYILAALVALSNKKSYRAKIEIDGSFQEEEFSLITVGNGKFCGGGFQLTPFANIYDNQFEICVVKAISAFETILLLPKALKGQHIENSKTTLRKFRKLSMVSNQDLPIYIDGEIPNFRNRKEIKVEISDKKLNLVVPAK